MPTIAVTGASGQLGRLVAEALLDAGAGDPLVLLSRDPTGLADLAERGAQTRRADFDDPATLAEAFAGVETLLLVSTDRIGDRVAGHLAAIEAAAAAGVRHIAYTSTINPSDSNPVAVAPEHRATEDALRASGVTWTFLRNATYAEMLAGPAQGALATGQWPNNEGSGTSAYISRADCAAVAAAVLADPAPHANRAYDVTGPEGLGPADVAALLGELGGREVTPVALDDDAYAAMLTEHAGLPAEQASVYASFGASVRRGYAAPVAPTVQDLTGRAPRSVRDVLAGLLPAVA